MAEAVKSFHAGCEMIMRHELHNLVGQNDTLGRLQTEMKCTGCGSSSLVVGTVLGAADGSTLGFYPSDTPALKRIFSIGSRAVQAYGCVRCRNLQFSVEFSERDLERYQEFEGEQPNVLERIN